VTVRSITLHGWKNRLIRICVNRESRITLRLDDAIKLADKIYAETAEYRFLKSLKGISDG
jgi:hypothetical protein